jgi:hypothetical protein
MTTTADTQALLVRLLDPSNRADPYPAYEQIRASGPLLLPEAHLTVFSSFTECDDVLRHPSSASDRMKSTLTQRAIANGEQERPVGPPGFLFLDPPDHTRLRKLVSKAFVPKVVKTGCSACRSRTNPSSVGPRHCSPRDSTRSSRSPAAGPTASTSGWRRPSGFATTCTPSSSSAAPNPATT